MRAAFSVELVDFRYDLAAKGLPDVDAYAAP
jgi:hypothetical protein